MEIQEKVIDFQTEKGNRLEITTHVVDGVVKPMIQDPILDSKLKIKPEEH